MPTLKELEKQLEDIQAAIEEAKKREQEGGILPVEGDFYLDARFEVETAGRTWRANRSDQNVFPDEETANAYGEAFRVMLELRRQPGSVVYDEYGGQYFIGTNGMVKEITDIHSVTLCPPFSSEEQANKAACTVGRTRIASAYNTLRGLVE